MNSDIDKHFTDKCQSVDIKTASSIHKNTTGPGGSVEQDWITAIKSECSHWLYYTGWRNIWHYDVRCQSPWTWDHQGAFASFIQLINAALDDLLGSTSTSWCDPLTCLRGLGRCSNVLVLQLPGTMYVEKDPAKMHIHWVMILYIFQALCSNDSKFTNMCVHEFGCMRMSICLWCLLHAGTCPEWSHYLVCCCNTHFTLSFKFTRRTVLQSKLPTVSNRSSSSMHRALIGRQ